MNARPTRILLVDDERDIVFVLKRGLELSGYEVSGFTDSREALENFVPNNFDAIITDIKMPNMTGIELYKAIREIDAAVRVYFISAFESYADEIKEMFSGDSETIAFIKKPTTYRTLAQRLDADLGRKHIVV